ncbi:unnamed protein product [Durusdinium trenchii]|uniref:RRM domain-containing protein n=1 Tax=Durusdinium trenchii TaxID=1381693 RepID=A0ABP0SU73_9DINO
MYCMVYTFLNISQILYILAVMVAARLTCRATELLGSGRKTAPTERPRTVISAPFRPSQRAGRPVKKQPRKAKVKAKKVKPKKAAKKAEPAPPVEVVELDDEAETALVILDSDEEAKPSKTRAKKARPVDHVSPSARCGLRQAARQRAEARAHFAAEEVGGAYVRLTFRSPTDDRLDARTSTLNACELETAFGRFGVRFVASLSTGEAVLATESAKEAVACALSFHGWPGRSPKGVELQVLKQISLAVAPVDCTGRATSPKTWVVSRSLVATSDGSSSKLV